MRERAHSSSPPPPPNPYAQQMTIGDKSSLLRYIFSFFLFLRGELGRMEDRMGKAAGLAVASVASKEMN